MAPRNRVGTCVACSRERKLNVKDLCPSCYVAAMQPTALCCGCNEVRKIQAKGLCRKCYLAQPEVRARKNEARTERYKNDPAFRLARQLERTSEAVRPHSVTRKREYDRQRNYALTPETYEALLAAQGHRCPICARLLDEHSARKDARPHVDHCHDTGKVRGILCGACNRGLGCFGDKDAAVGVLRAAANYLSR